MNIDMVVKLDGREYRLTCDPDTGPPDECWSWADVRTNMTPTATVIHELNNRFLAQHADWFLKTCGQKDLFRFQAVLRSMGATDDDFAWLGLEFLIEPNDDIDLRYRSPLHVMGYQVGQRGLSDSTRRRILREAFTEDIPNVRSTKYMASWGLPGSEERLKKIAYHIWYSIGSSRPADYDYSEADADWRSDVAWLKSTFYDGKFSFRWPGTVDTDSTEPPGTT